MSHEPTTRGSIVETSEEALSQPRFIGNLALVLIALLILFPLYIWLAVLTHA